MAFTLIKAAASRLLQREARLEPSPSSSPGLAGLRLVQSGMDAGARGPGRERRRLRSSSHVLRLGVQREAVARCSQPRTRFRSQAVESISFPTSDSRPQGKCVVCGVISWLHLGTPTWQVWIRSLGCGLLPPPHVALWTSWGVEGTRSPGARPESRVAALRRCRLLLRGKGFLMPLPALGTAGSVTTLRDQKYNSPVAGS